MRSVLPLIHCLPTGEMARVRPPIVIVRIGRLRSAGRMRSKQMFRAFAIAMTSTWKN